MTAMELLTIPGLDNSKKLENVRKDSMEKAVSNLARMKGLEYRQARSA